MFNIYDNDEIARREFRMVGNLNQNSWAVGSVGLDLPTIQEHTAAAMSHGHVALQSKVFAFPDLGNIPDFWAAFDAKNLPQFIKFAGLLGHNVSLQVALICGGRRLVAGPYRIGDTEVMLSGDPIQIWAPKPALTGVMAPSSPPEESQCNEQLHGKREDDSDSCSEAPSHTESDAFVEGDPSAPEQALDWARAVLDAQEVHDEHVEASGQILLSRPLAIHWFPWAWF